MIKGKAVALEVEKSQKISHGYDHPLVIRLLYYVKIPRKEIPLTRKNVMHRDQYTCQYCGKRSHLTIDHIVPRSRGGKDVWENVTVACLACNTKKGCRTPKEANMPLDSKPNRPHHFLYFELSKQQRQSKNQHSHWRKYLFMD